MCENPTARQSHEANAGDRIYLRVAGIKSNVANVRAGPRRRPPPTGVGPRASAPRSPLARGAGTPPDGVGGAGRRGEHAHAGRACGLTADIQPSIGWGAPGSHEASLHDCS